MGVPGKNGSTSLYNSIAPQKNGKVKINGITSSTLTEYACRE